MCKMSFFCSLSFLFKKKRSLTGGKNKEKNKLVKLKDVLMHTKMADNFKHLLAAYFNENASFRGSQDFAFVCKL